MSTTATKPERKRQGPGQGVYPRPPRCARCDELLGDDILTRVGATRAGEERSFEFCSEACAEKFENAWQSLQTIATEKDDD